MLTSAVFFALLAFITGSMLYVYRLRGTVRYADFKEYVRKGWPIFAPFNCLLYLFTRPKARRPIMDVDAFGELDDIRHNWETIRDEAVNLYQQRLFETTSSPDSAAYYDIGFRTFYKYGWRKFYLNWYGYTHHSARRLCPQTVEILERNPAVNGAMFSVLPVGGKLTRHADPVACSLRYHLGLATPESDACYINIDGTDYSWRDGESLLFDETYLHYAHNDAERYRLILMCDVKRPTYLLGSLVNFFYKHLMRATIVPNLPEDKRGFANRLFTGLTPLLERSKRLKQTNLPLYRVVKYGVNTTLAVLALALTTGLCVLLYELATFSA